MGPSMPLPDDCHDRIGSAMFSEVGRWHPWWCSTIRFNDTKHELPLRKIVVETFLANKTNSQNMRNRISGSIKYEGIYWSTLNDRQKTIENRQMAVQEAGEVYEVRGGFMWRMRGGSCHLVCLSVYLHGWIDGMSGRKCGCADVRMYVCRCMCVRMYVCVCADLCAREYVCTCVFIAGKQLILCALIHMCQAQSCFVCFSWLTCEFRALRTFPVTRAGGSNIRFRTTPMTLNNDIAAFSYRYGSALKTSHPEKTTK